MKLLSAIPIVVFAFFSSLATAQNLPINPSSASPQMNHPGSYRPGEDLSVRIKLDKPLPEGANVRVDFYGKGQGFSTGETVVSQDRTEVVAKAKVIDTAITGEWQINNVIVFASGGAPTQSVALKDPVHFFVEGRPVINFPTTAEISVSPEKR